MTRGTVTFRPLALEEIRLLTNRPNVRARAVENFLVSLPKRLSFSGMLSNLAMDARLYGWSAETVEAIREGLALAVVLDETQRDEADSLRDAQRETWHMQADQ